MLGQRLQDAGAEASDGALLDGDEHFVLAREPQREIDIEWLGEARIGNRRHQTMRRQGLGRQQAFRQARAE